MKSHRRKLIISLFFLSSALFILNLIALDFYLYWTTWWMDIINHFLGGVIVGVAFVILSTSISGDKNIFNLKYFYLGLMSILFVGVLWEIFELYYGLTDVSAEKYWGDTILDLIMDVAGMLTTYVYLSGKKQNGAA